MPISLTSWRKIILRHGTNFFLPLGMGGGSGMGSGMGSGTNTGITGNTGGGHHTGSGTGMGGGYSSSLLFVYSLMSMCLLMLYQLISICEHGLHTCTRTFTNSLSSEMLNMCHVLLSGGQQYLPGRPGFIMYILQDTTTLEPALARTLPLLT